MYPHQRSCPAPLSPSSLSFLSQGGTVAIQALLSFPACHLPLLHQGLYALLAGSQDLEPAGLRGTLSQGLLMNGWVVDCVPALVQSSHDS